MHHLMLGCKQYVVFYTGIAPCTLEDQKFLCLPFCRESGCPMPRLARVEVSAADEVAIVHVMSSTVRWCFLRGDDPVTGRNYDHRKVWIDEQIVHQAKHLGIDLLCQAIMSNHLHLVLRSRPGVFRDWNSEWVAHRWLMLCPERRDEERRPPQPTEFEINRIVNNEEKLASLRSHAAFLVPLFV